MTDLSEVEILTAQRSAERQQLTAALINIGLNALSQRLVTILALLLDTGIFAWAISTESWVRLAGAVAFSVAAWCVIHLHPQGESK